MSDLVQYGDAVVAGHTLVQGHLPSKPASYLAQDVTKELLSFFRIKDFIFFSPTDLIKARESVRNDSVHVF